MVKTLFIEFKEAFTVDYRSLALFRICLGLILLADFYLRLPYVELFLSDYGAIPREMLAGRYSPFFKLLYFLSGEPWLAYFLLCVNALAALALTVGFKTRWAAVICFVLAVCLQWRAPAILSLADTLIKCLLFWSIFLPLNRHFSFDQAVFRRGESIESNSHFSIASFAMIMQVLYVYWVGALLKTGDEWVTDFTAVELALSAEHYAYDLGGWVAANFDWALSELTVFVYAIELYGPFLILAPVVFRYVRLPIVFMLIAMHLGFVTLLNVGIFPFVSICSLLVLVNSPFWEKLGGFLRSKKGQGVTVYYDGSCEFCLKTVMLLKQFFILPQVKIEIAQDNAEANKLFLEHDSWVVQNTKGERFIEWTAMQELLNHSALKYLYFLPIAIIKHLGLGGKLYHAIGNRRRGLGKITGIALPWRDTRFDYQKKSLSLIGGIMFLLVFLVNIAPLERVQKISFLENSVAIQRVNDVVYLIGINQKWRMFAPRPVNTSQWPIIEGTSVNGMKIDLFRQKTGEAPRAKPERILNEFEYYRVRKYFENLYMTPRLREYYLDYLCRDWQEQNDEKDSLKEINMWQGQQISNPLDEYGKQEEHIHLSKVEC